MILHYLKTVFRGMRNYKTQSIINITGLAIGFTAFALAGYWYLWEHSFDTFIRNGNVHMRLRRAAYLKSAQGRSWK